MANFYSDGARTLQKAFDTEALAGLLHKTIVHDEFSDSDKAFIEARNCFYLATVDQYGFPQCSYKGGATGFVRILTASTLAFPAFDGNGMFLSAGNIRDTAKVGMLFIDSQQPNRLRVNGTASVNLEDPLQNEFHEAQFIVRVDVHQIFINCGRYIHPSVQQSQAEHVPMAGKKTPKADWQELEFFKEVLPKGNSDL